MRDFESDLGEPDLTVQGFRLWVHGYESSNPANKYDADWLMVTAHYADAGATVLLSGPYLYASSLLRFRDDVASMHDTLRGEASMGSDEPNLALKISVEDNAGHLLGRLDITPDNVQQMHWFEFELDQSDLPGLVQACDGIIERLPRRPGKA